MARWIKTYHDDFMNEDGDRIHLCIFTRIGNPPNGDLHPRRVGGWAIDNESAHATAERRACQAIATYDSAYRIVSSR